MCLAVLRIYPSVWRNRPRVDSYSSLWSPSDFFPSRNLWNQPLSYPQPAGSANTISELHFLLPINREPPDSLELLHRGGGRCPLVNLPLSGLLLPRTGCGSGGRRWLFLWISQGETWACPSSLENAKPVGQSSSGRIEATPRRME